LKEGAIAGLLFLCALISVATTGGIIYTLFTETISFFRDLWGQHGLTPLDFLFGREWAPLLEPRHFGVLPLVGGTLLVAILAGVLAIPLGLFAAIYVSEYARKQTRRLVKPIMEVLAGIPTVVYGYFALTFVSPHVVRAVFPNINPFDPTSSSTAASNALSGAIALAIMILPTIASLCDDALRAVPDSLRQAGYAMGATKLEVATQVMVPGALSGIIAAFILALSRAIGETMIVVIACGGQPLLTINPLEQVQTMTAYIVAISLGDTPHGTIEYETIFAVGALLFLITLAMNIVAHKVLRRFREVYD
jgi:phosphate transport system permease protein